MKMEPDQRMKGGMLESWKAPKAYKARRSHFNVTPWFVGTIFETCSVAVGLSPSWSYETTHENVSTAKEPISEH